jgi:hypothetical protein
MTKLVNKMNNGWDEHLHIVLYDYQTSLKVTIGPTPFQLMYGLHPLVLTKCLLPTKSLFKY